MSQPELIIVDSIEGIEALREYLSDKDYVAYDCETTGLLKTSEVIGVSVCGSEDRAYYIILSKWSAAEQRMEYLGLYDHTKALIEQIRAKQLVMHNAIFDCMMAEAYFKTSLIESLHTDTMILAHLLDENRRIGLKELGADLFGEDSTKEAKEMKASVLANGGQLTKDRYEMYKADAYLMAKYGAKDAWLTYKLFLSLVPELYEQELDKFFYEEESMPLLKQATYDLNTQGLSVDLSALATLKKTLEAECIEDNHFINTETAPLVKDKYPGTNKKNKFSIGSTQQLSWLLFDKLGLEFSTLTKGGKAVAKALELKHYSPAEKRTFMHEVSQRKGQMVRVKVDDGAFYRPSYKDVKLKDPWCYIACDKATLSKLAPKYRWIERLLQYNKKKKLLNTYVEGIQDRAVYGVIYPGFLQAGTTSGRYSSRNPNFQNLPRDDKRVKACIKSRPGKVFVGADYSQLEPRVFASVSGDTNLLKAFDGENDFYSVIGMDVYNKTDCTPQKDGSENAFGVKYKKLRDLSKVIALASVYGATARQLAKTTGKSIEDTQLDIDNYFEAFPGVRNMMTASHDMAKKDGYVTSLFGRKRRMPEAKRIPKLFGNTPHAELEYNWRKMLNLAVNHRIQSTGASIVNRAAIRFYQLCEDAGIKAKIVLQVHDSLVAECDEKDSENVSLLLQHAMENTNTLLGVTLEAIPKVGYTLAEV